MSGWNFAGTYETRFTAVNQVQPVAEQVAMTYDQLKVKVGEVGTASEQMSFRSVRAFQGLIFGAQMSLFYVSMLASGLLRDESAVLQVEAAEERLNKALKEHGRKSEEAVSATRQLEQAHIYLQRAQA